MFQAQLNIQPLETSVYTFCQDFTPSYVPYTVFIRFSDLFEVSEGNAMAIKQLIKSERSLLLKPAYTNKCLDYQEALTNLNKRLKWT